MEAACQNSGRAIPPGARAGCPAGRTGGTLGLTGRVELRLQDAVTLDEPDAYDVVWLPMPFLPAGTVPAVLRTSCRALRPGGWLLAGTFTGPPTRLGRLLTDLRTVRSGGHPWQPAELLGVLDEAGLQDVGEVPRAWAAPVRLYAGRRQL